MERIFTQEELRYCLAKDDPWPSLAARFAAKEAVMKAMGVGLGDISVAEHRSGQRGLSCPCPKIIRKRVILC